jgi:hypothetical protein
MSEKTPLYRRGNYKTEKKIKVITPTGVEHIFESYTAVGAFFGLSPQTISIKMKEIREAEIDEPLLIKMGKMKGFYLQFIDDVKIYNIY